MVWWIIVVVAAVVILPELLGHGLREIGPWAFTRRADGTFSRLQIAGQIFVIGVPALLTICLFAGWIVRAIRGG